MKQSLVLLPGFAWLAAAACCRSNQCLRVIADDSVLGRDGRADCSSFLAITVTPETITVYETVSEAPVDFTTQVTTKVSTVTEITTASTETALVTVKTSSTATTELLVSTTVETVVAATVTQTSVTYTTKTGAQGLKVRQDAEPVIPEYASPACSSFAKYASACACAGVTAETVTAGSAPVTTVTMTETSTVLSTVLSTEAAAETTTVSVVVTTSETTTEVDLLTATLASTTTSTALVTATTSATTTQVVGSCLTGAVLGAFKANATQYNNSPLNIYANLLNGLTGGLTWNAASASTAAAVQNKYIWALDAAGRLNVAYNVPPYTYKYYAYMSTATQGSNWPQVNTEASVASQVNSGAAVTYLVGCVDSVTGELTLNAAGRTHILYCGSQLWMSYTSTGEDSGRGTCTEMFPRVGRV
ncbi:hypothetical protein B0H66DRAFT_616880 [Apodospora peruviana]|uniref:Uncharacterized protein n=1 Tax=Apodospora peruviana TaxID=516989 RepID=A0AAE0IJ85_9PEZI|nr:hypothetical protein B0H66DRAFT_616880 [Apodospora peruviana]